MTDNKTRILKKLDTRIRQSGEKSNGLFLFDVQRDSKINDIKSAVGSGYGMWVGWLVQMEGQDKAEIIYDGDVWSCIYGANVLL